MSEAEKAEEFAERITHLVKKKKINGWERHCGGECESDHVFSVSRKMNGQNVRIEVGCYATDSKPTRDGWARDTAHEFEMRVYDQKSRKLLFTAQHIMDLWELLKERYEARKETAEEAVRTRAKNKRAREESQEMRRFNRNANRLLK